MAHRYEFTFDRHSELSHEVIKNIKDYLGNLTDGRVVWNIWSIPDEMALCNLEQQEYSSEFEGEPVRTAEPVRFSETPTLEEIHQAYEYQHIGYVEAPSAIAPGEIISIEDF